eukprot:352385-Chlamydomonas_euryale.AAC.2
MHACVRGRSHVVDGSAHRRSMRKLCTLETSLKPCLPSPPPHTHPPPPYSCEKLEALFALPPHCPLLPSLLYPPCPHARAHLYMSASRYISTDVDTLLDAACSTTWQQHFSDDQ